jgi:hypothetical protein
VAHIIKFEEKKLSFLIGHRKEILYIVLEKQSEYRKAQFFAKLMFRYSLMMRNRGLIMYETSKKVLFLN